MSVFNDLKERLSQKDIKAAVIGLGYVGLPLTVCMGSNGIEVYAFDTDETKLKDLSEGKSYIDGVSSESVRELLLNKKLSPFGDFSKLSEVDFIVICVPTPLDQHYNPDLSYIESTTKTISKYLRPGQIIILESTTYPGTMTDVVNPILEMSGHVYGHDYHLAYSPEREDPGRKTHTTHTIPKIIGADLDEARELTQAFYEIFIEQMVPVSSMAVAEAAKIMENIFRSVNIALVNELKVIFGHMNIDIWEVIEAVKTKPFGYMPFYPGPGLGGHCIPIDPFYLSWKAKEYGINTRFIELAGEINTLMPDYVVQKTIWALNTKEKSLRGSKILILGIAYKKNVDDQRETPAFPIMKALMNGGASLEYYDPHIPEIKPNRHYPELQNLKAIDWKIKDLNKYDAIVIVTDHDKIAYSDLALCDNLIIDTRNAMKKFSKNENIFKA